MKFSFITSVLLTAVVTLTPTSQVRGDEVTPLTEQMEIMDDAYKAFRRETDPEKGAALAREAQDAILKAIPLVPQLVADIADPAARAKAVVAYKIKTTQLFQIYCDVELAFLESDLDAVAEKVKQLREMKKEGHDEFMKDE